MFSTTDKGVTVSTNLTETPTTLERADALLAQMTIEEKAQQLSAVMPIGLIGTAGLIPDALDRQFGNGIGHVSAFGMFGNKSPLAMATYINGIQRYLVEQTRLGIPAIFHNEALNGVVAPEFTPFPTAIALAATWNPDGVREMAELIRKQMRSVGMVQALSPVMDLARDARWGRVHETYGEDAYLVSAFSVAFTQGLQGEDLIDGVIATAKHFLGYGVTEAGQNMAASEIGTRQLFDDFARPFAAAIQEAGLASIMPSYSTIDGVPVTASRGILKTLLRDELGFTGTVVSDYNAVAMLTGRQRVAADLGEAGAIALEAGLDVELPNIMGYGPKLAAEVRSGRVSEGVLDDSVRRVLRDKFALGLFENPYVAEDGAALNELAHSGGELSANLARQSVTLLKNDGGILPLATSTARIAIIGPHADSVAVNFPGYTFPAAAAMLKTMAMGGDGSMAGVEELGAEMTPDVMAAMGAELGPVFAVTDEEYIRASYGAVSLAEAVRALVPDATITVVTGSGLTEPAAEPNGIAAAVAAAREADVVILAIGGRGGWFAGAITEGEGADTANIDLPAAQLELIDALAETGVPLVAALSMGRPYALTPVIEKLSAVLTSYYGGPHGGQAAAEALFGKFNPAGRLPVTIPRHSGQAPIYAAQHTGSGYRRLPGDMHRGYIDMPSTPLYAFGHGLSYTDFEYSELSTNGPAVPIDGEITVAVTVSNTGSRGGDEVVQLYVADTAPGITRPAQELAGFSRVWLDAGQSRRIEFTVPLSQLGYTGLAGEFVIEPGPIEVMVGSSSADIRAQARVEVTGAARNLKGKRSFLSTVTVS